MLAKVTVARFKVSTGQTLAPFHFVVPGDEVHISLSTQLNRVGLVLAIWFESLEIKTHTAAIAMTIQKWERYGPFTQDTELKTEYFTMAAAGLPLLRKAVENINKILSYIDTDKKYEPPHKCTLVPRNLTADDFAKAAYNLDKRFGHIESSWTPSSIKTDKGQSNVLLMFVFYLNEMGQYLYEKTEDLLVLLESLSDNEFPLQLEKDLQNSACIPGHEGEKFDITECTKTNKGLSCTAQVAVPQSLQTFTEMHRVAYEYIALDACPDCKYLKNPTTGAMSFVNCSTKIKTTEDFPTCSVVLLENDCIKELESGGITDIIKQCSFEEFSPDLVTLLPNSGILIQASEDAIISSGTKPLHTKGPIVVFSPETITISDEGQELSIPSNENVTSLVIVKSLLTDKDITALLSKYYWENLKDSFETDDYVRFVLLGLQILFLPVSIGISILLYYKGKISKAKNKQNEGRQNYEEMRAMYPQKGKK